MISNIFSDSNLNGESAGESKVVRLGVWEEARGCLKEIDSEEGEVVLEVRREFKIKLPPQKLDDLKGSIGEKISVLKTDGSVDDDFLVNIEGDGNV